MADIAETDNKLNTLNRKLDDVLVNFFETLGELYKEQANLENLMKSGFLMMSRARYNMGAKSVGISQYNERNMKASKVVTMTTDSVNSSQTFELVNPCDYPVESSEESDLLKGSSELRQRKGGGVEKVETIGPESGEKSSAKFPNSNTANDPIKWFGVLVPQSLRQSQECFKQATDSVVTVSNLKTKVLHLKEEYKSLLKEKQLESA